MKYNKKYFNEEQVKFIELTKFNEELHSYTHPKHTIKSGKDQGKLKPITKTASGFIKGLDPFDPPISDITRNIAIKLREGGKVDTFNHINKVEEETSLYISIRASRGSIYHAVAEEMMWHRSDVKNEGKEDKFDLKERIEYHFNHYIKLWSKQQEARKGKIIFSNKFLPKELWKPFSHIKTEMDKESLNEIRSGLMVMIKNLIEWLNELDYKDWEMIASEIPLFWEGEEMAGMFDVLMRVEKDIIKTDHKTNGSMGHGKIFTYGAQISLVYQKMVEENMPHLNVTKDFIIHNHVSDDINIMRLNIKIDWLRKLSKDYLDNGTEHVFFKRKRTSNDKETIVQWLFSLQDEYKQKIINLHTAKLVVYDITKQRDNADRIYNLVKEKDWFDKQKARHTKFQGTAVWSNTISTDVINEIKKGKDGK